MSLMLAYQQCLRKEAIKWVMFVVCKTVEEASARAAAATFGEKAPSSGKRTVKSAVVDAHLHEAAFCEGY